jgi:hypothetical protein
MILHRLKFYPCFVLFQIFCFAFLSMAQTKQWTRLCGSSGYDWGRGVAVDAGGNVYVTGETAGAFDSQSFAGATDICLIKYDSGGTKLWTRLCGTPSEDAGYGVAVDAGGNVYVVGYTYGGLDGQIFAGKGDICLVKYNSGGTKQWTRLCGSSGYDWGRGVAIDAGGNVYVTGRASGAFDGQPYAGADDICLVKYNSNGTKLWTRLYGTSGYEWVYGVAVDADGNAYVTGGTTDTLDNQPFAGYRDIFLVKYDSSGTKQWTRLCGNDGADFGYGVAVDANRNVYVTGYTHGILDGQTFMGAMDICLIKYDSGGTKLWTRLCGTGGEDAGYSVAVDAGGNVYVTGNTYGPFDGQPYAGYFDIFLVKYNNNGTKQWTRQSGIDTIDFGQGVAVDARGNVYVTGYTFGALDGQPFAGNSDMCLLKYAPPPIPARILPPIAMIPKRMRTDDVQMFDIFGRRINRKDLSRRPAGIYLLQSKSALFCEKKMILK